MALLGACGGGIVQAVTTSAEVHAWQHARRLALTSKNRLLVLVLTSASLLARLFPDPASLLAPLFPRGSAP